MTLIIFNLTGIPSYIIIFTQVPKYKATQIDKLIESFSSEIHRRLDSRHATNLVAWEKICRPKFEGC